MRNQTVSHPIHAGRRHRDRKHVTRYLIAAAVLFMMLITSACGAALPVAENQPDETLAAEQTNLVKKDAVVQRAFDADAARYSGLANLYSSESEANSHQGIEAEAARYTGLANFYASENEANGPQAMEAEAARYNGLAVRYSIENGIDESPTFDIEHLRQIYDANWGIEADAADVHRTVQPIKGNVASEPPAFDIEHLGQIYDANWGIEADAVDLNPAGLSNTILATNPELALVQRYTGMVEWQRLHHPGR